MSGTDRRAPDWSAASWAGLSAAVVFVLFELALAGLVGAATWTAPHLITATIKGGEFIGGSDMGVEPLLLILAGAMVMHVGLAIAYTMLIAWVTRDWALPATLLAGLGFGLAIYLVNFYGVLRLFPELAQAQPAGGPVTLSSHLVFGVVAAGGYCVLAARRRRRHALNPRPA